MPSPTVERAYSLLHIKAIDEQTRTITGTATTPTPDRMGDVVEPLGVQFSNPLPLLLYHNSQKPVGSVRFSKPTAAGIDFEATLPTVPEPGTVRDRIEEAWQSLKYRLLTAVSIGFRSLEDALIRETSSYHFLQTEVLELSLVAIPANAEAVIATIKSIDARDRAAFGGDRATVRTKSAGDTARPPIKALTPGKDPVTMKTTAEQIAAFQATRAAKAAARTTIMTKAAEEGVTLDTEQAKEYDALALEIKDIDAHLARLTDLEREQKAAAVPVVEVVDHERASELRGGGAIRVKDNLPPGIEFARYAMCLMAARGMTGQALEIAKSRYPDQQRIQQVLKSAVAAGTTTDPTWAGSLVFYQQFAADFIDFLRPMTVIGKFGVNGIPSLRRVPFNIRIVGQTSGGAGYWVGQGKSKPLTKFDFEPTTLRWAKVANIAVISEELARFSSPSAEMLVRDGLAAALVARMDTDFVDPSKAAVADVSPASITHGISALVPSGTDADAVRADIQALFAPFIAANLTPTNGVWIMSNTTALALSLMKNALGQPEFPGISMMGGVFQGLPVIASQYAHFDSPTNNIVILVNASDIYLSDDGQVVIDASREASLEMDDSPSNNSGSPNDGSSMVSLWQTNSIGLRAERFVNWARRREQAVQYMENVAWGSAGSPE